MRSYQTYSFSKPGFGSLDLEVDHPSKQVHYSANFENFPFKLEGIGNYPLKPMLPIYFFEWQNIQYTYTIEKDSAIFTPPYQLRINNRIEKVAKEPKSGVYILAGRFSFSDEVGLTRIEIRDANNRLIFGLETEVFPQKMDYKSDYQAMMADISSIIQNLAYDSLKNTFQKSRSKLIGHTTLNEWWNILNILFDELVLNLGVIRRQPNHEIRTSEKVFPVERIKQASKRNIDWFKKNVQFSNQVGRGVNIGGKSYYSHALASHKYTTYDTYENRFVAWAIKNTIDQLKYYRLHTERNQGNNDYSVLFKMMKDYQSRLQGILHEHPFDEVGHFEERSHFSTSLTRGAGYRDFMHIYLLLTRGLEIAQNDIFKIETKNISTLYEYWCFLMLVKILKEQNASEIDYQDLIKIKAGKVKVELEKGHKSKVTFKNKITDELTTVHFNREFPRDAKKIFTYNQRPDYSVEFKKRGFDKPFWYLFDAKYRFDENLNIEDEAFNVPQDAIGQLHRYRDAILHSEPTNSTYRGAIKNLGGIILYPYPLSEDKYEKENRYFKSINEVNIGALPFLPSKTKLVSELLNSLINKNPEEHFEKFIDMDREEYEKHRNLWKEWVTIGVIPKAHQQERINFIKDKFLYHIPFVANANSKLYMTKKLLLCRAGTTEAFLYDVRSWEILTDKELQLRGTFWPHRQEKYVVFNLTNEIIFKTPTNISPMSFRYTTFEGLKRYMEAHGDKRFLYLTNPDAARLFEELRKLEIKFSIDWVQKSNDPSLVEFTIGEIKVYSSEIFKTLHFKLNNREIHFYELIKALNVS
jgi:predicted component of viral defense system (DUF524 family)